MFSIRPNPIWCLLALVLLIGTAACGRDSKIDDRATGIDLTVRRVESLLLDQIRLRADIAAQVVFGPVFVPETPKAFAIEESVVVLFDDDLDGQVIDLVVDGYFEGQGLTTAGTTATLTAQSLSAATVDLVIEEPAACGDQECAVSEKDQCSCPDDCPRVCGDGCCSAPQEKNGNCPEDCP